MSNVILIGYMGCGKSTVGVKLSYRLQQPFLDTDKIIEKKQERTISDIFATEGERYFRQLETACVKELLNDRTSYVIATGGGLPVQKENQPLLKKLGKVIYLRAVPETIYDRIKDDTRRPLLQGENPMEKIRTMIKARGPEYEACADVIIDVDGKTFAQILTEIEEAVR